MTNEQLSELVTMLHKRLKEANVKPDSQKGKIMATEFMVGAMTALHNLDARVSIVIMTGRIVTEEFKHLIKEDT